MCLHRKIFAVHADDEKAADLVKYKKKIAHFYRPLIVRTLFSPLDFPIPIVPKGRNQPKRDGFIRYFTYRNSFIGAI